MPKLTALTLYSIFSLLPPALCHMEMSWPYSFRSSFDPDNNYENIDYSNKSPLLPDGSNFPCKGYQNDGDTRPRTSYVPGLSYNISLAGSATHGGGSCQLSLSYDNGTNFRVIKSIIGHCPLSSTYNFNIPTYAPAGKALLAWTWQNFEGNREFNMNCAPVEVKAAPARKRRRRGEFYSFTDLPFIWKANLAGINNCTTTDSENVVYPNPGPDVQYADGVSADTTPTEGDCDFPPPYGRELNFSNKAAGLTNTSTAAITFSYASSSTQIVTPSASSTTSSLTLIYGTSSPPAHATASSAYMANITMSTTTITVADDDCASVVTVFITATVYTTPTSTSTLTPADASMSGATSTSGIASTGGGASTSGATSTPATTSTPASAFTSDSACTATIDPCPCASGYGCQYLGSCEWQCVASSTSPASATGYPTMTVTATPSASSALGSTVSYTPAMTSDMPPGDPTITVTATPVPYTPSPSPSPYTLTPPQPAAEPTYATADPSTYLPCVPGSFLCTSATTWLTCDYSDGTSPSLPATTHVYDYPKTVAAGMQCLPSLSRYGESDGSAQYAQQAQTPGGYYRDDKIVRARPDGSCSTEGAIQCTDGGSTFDLCDQGGWVEMGPVAAGTTCENGGIVSSS
ncbi:hypothetical protein LTR62_006221 [Meristemomyces frigidus]|uniref:Chitin-binding type-4 domain-containing protein n=1 Tax=Meristemomyces frigidus TaxID=1508187 RepID=A0AAN7TK73_9PEZI|nr:hypothetical protein LTR62_006221 [Meristemomyces frigidus]